MCFPISLSSSAVAGLFICFDLAASIQIGVHLTGRLDEFSGHSLVSGASARNAIVPDESSGQRTNRIHEVAFLANETVRGINGTLQVALHALENNIIINDSIGGGSSHLGSALAGTGDPVGFVFLVVVCVMVAVGLFVTIGLLLATPASSLGAPNCPGPKRDQQRLICSDRTLQGKLAKASAVVTELLSGGACNIMTDNGSLVLRATLTDDGSVYRLGLASPTRSAIIASVFVPKASRTEPSVIKDAGDREFGQLKSTRPGAHIITCGGTDVYSIVTNDMGRTYIMQESGQVTPLVGATRRLSAWGPKIQTSPQVATKGLGVFGNVDILELQSVKSADAVLALICILSLIVVNRDTPSHSVMPSRASSFHSG